MTKPGLLLWLPLLWPDRERPRVGEVELVVIDLAVLCRERQFHRLFPMSSSMTLMYWTGPIRRLK